MLKNRHPDLHPNPEVLAMPATAKANAWIELGQHEDGRWMWGLNVFDRNQGYGFACSAKWQRFAPTRDMALRAAIAEAFGYLVERNRADGDVAGWLGTLGGRTQDAQGQRGQ